MAENHQTKNSDTIDAQSPKGLAILKHAFSEGGKVLEFTRTDDGEMTVADVTDHYNELEKQANANSNRETTNTS